MFASFLLFALAVILIACIIALVEVGVDFIKTYEISYWIGIPISGIVYIVAAMAAIWIFVQAFGFLHS